MIAIMLALGVLGLLLMPCSAGRRPASIGPRARGWCWMRWAATRWRAACSS